MNRGAGQVPVNGLQCRLFFEDDVGGVLALVHAPVVAVGEIAVDRTAQPCQFIQSLVDSLCLPAIGDGLCLFPVSDVREGVVGHPILDPGLTQLPR